MNDMPRKTSIGAVECCAISYRCIRSYFQGDVDRRKATNNGRCSERVML